MISIHALREEGDNPAATYESLAYNFYPRPPRGGRPYGLTADMSVSKFLSTPSARRATGVRTAVWCWMMHFYPRPPRGGRPERQVVRVVDLGISIHALREEGDELVCVSVSGSVNFYPRPPRGGRLYKSRLRDVLVPISIHALREEGDHPQQTVTTRRTAFLSTPSARRATQQDAAMDYNSAISIHALREEGDLVR